MVDSVNPDSPIEERSQDSEDEDDDEDLLSGYEKDNSFRVRMARLNLYYATSTSTSTSYTGTSTLATLECTPAGYTLSACSG